jgi:hypothetical protein
LPLLLSPSTLHAVQPKIITTKARPGLQNRKQNEEIKMRRGEERAQNGLKKREEEIKMTKRPRAKKKGKGARSGPRRKE